MVHGIFTASFYALTLIFQDPAETTIESHSNLTDNWRYFRDQSLYLCKCGEANYGKQTWELDVSKDYGSHLSFEQKKIETKLHNS